MLYILQLPLEVCVGFLFPPFLKVVRFWSLYLVLCLGAKLIAKYIGLNSIITCIKRLLPMFQCFNAIKLSSWHMAYEIEEWSLCL
jgi:hypothetical protein